MKTTKNSAADNMKHAASMEQTKTRAIRETKQGDFLKVVNEIIAILETENFDNSLCEFTGDGLYKVTDTKPTDMTGVKTHEENGLVWYKVPTTEYKTSFFSYLQYRLTKREKAQRKLVKDFANLSLEEQIQLLASLAK